MSDMVTMQIEMPVDVHNMLLKLLDEFQEETGLNSHPDLMITGAIRMVYMLGQ